MSRTHRLSQLGNRLAALIGGLAVALLLVEGALRLLIPEGPLARDLARTQLAPGPSPALPYLGLPDCATCRPELNSLGFPGPEPFADEQSHLRIALLGDSMCQGPSLSYDQTIPAHLQRLLTGHPSPRVRITVSSFCVPGHGPLEAREILTRYVLPRRPDLVLHLVSYNDESRMLYLGTRAPEGSAVRPVSLVPLAGVVAPFSWIGDGARLWLTRHSHLYQQIGAGLSLLLADWGVVHPDEAGRIDGEQLAQIFAQEVAACRAAGVELGVVLVPRASHALCRPRPDQPPPAATCVHDDQRFDRFQALFQGSAVPVLDLRLPLLTRQGLDLGRGESAPDDREHFGPAGHEFAARRIVPFVRPLLPLEQILLQLRLQP